MPSVIFPKKKPGKKIHFSTRWGKELGVGPRKLHWEWVPSLISYKKMGFGEKTNFTPNFASPLGHELGVG